VLADGGSTALVVIIVLSIVVPLTVLGVVVWVFWRSARRFDAEQERTSGGARRLQG
jgi:heme/copper-type cytochrome/quinol oxidase subunit 2